VAGINLITKEVATIWGLSFTIVFFVIFTVSEHINQRKLDKSVAALDQFTLNYQPDVSLDTVGARPGAVLVAVRDYNTLSHLDYALEHTDTEDQDIVVMTTRLIRGPDGGEYDLYESTFSDYERRLFTRVVGLAEKHGKPVELVVVPATNVFDAVAQTAVRLDAAEIEAGVSAKMTPQEQARELGRAWERLPEKPRRQVWLKIAGPDNQVVYSVYLGAHAPDLTVDDVSLIHKIWLQVSRVPARQRVRHRDVVRVALDRLERDLRGQSDVMLDFYNLEHKSADEPARSKSARTSAGNPP
jgi:hypothetical protein